VYFLALKPCAARIYSWTSRIKSAGIRSFGLPFDPFGDFGVVAPLVR
jgi:hypothetical protein